MCVLLGVNLVFSCKLVFILGLLWELYRHVALLPVAYLTPFSPLARLVLARILL